MQSTDACRKEDKRLNCDLTKLGKTASEVYKNYEKCVRY